VEFDFERERERMVETQLRRRDIRAPEVLRAMGAVPRHRFVIPSDWDEAYDDHPLRIGCEQTISQPYIVAYMTQALAMKRGARVLEVGTGSGYQTAVLAEAGAQVYSVERHEPLLEQAEVRLAELGYTDRVHRRLGDGTLGWPEEAPFDGILVTAAAPAVPPALQGQLAPGGRMVIPVAGGRSQHLEIVTRRGETFETRRDMSVIFVRLVGAQGY